MTMVRNRSLNEPGREGMRRGGTPAQILDLLEFDRGWLTAAGIAVDLKLSEELVDRCLYRLRKAGRVENRKVGLAGSRRGDKAGTPEIRTEWRALIGTEGES